MRFKISFARKWVKLFPVRSLWSPGSGVSHGVSMSNIVITYLPHADYLVLISKTPDELQRLTDGLHEFCNQWHLLLNLMKPMYAYLKERHRNVSGNPNYFTMGEMLIIMLDTSVWEHSSPIPKTWWRHQMGTFPRYWSFVRGIHRWIPCTN